MFCTGVGSVHINRGRVYTIDPCCKGELPTRLRPLKGFATAYELSTLENEGGNDKSNADANKGSD